MSQTPPPLRVERIDYQMPAPGRPGILTAVGIVSIVIASLSMIAECGGAVYAIAFGMMSPMRRMIAPPPTTAQTMPAVISNPRGMPVEQRRIVVAAMSGSARLSERRQKMLDKLLAEAGGDMFFGAQYDVSETGRLPTVGNEPGNDYFVIGRGRIELADDHAVFSPTNGETIRVYSAASMNSSTTLFAAYSTTSSATMTFPTSAMVSTTSAAFYGVTSLCNLVLAIFLLIAGILVLRDSQRGRRMHLIYAGLKIPVAIAEACAYAWMMSKMMGGMGMPLPPPPVTIMMTISAAVQGAISCAYPVALLIVMSRPTIKEYYSVRI